MKNCNSKTPKLDKGGFSYAGPHHATKRQINRASKTTHLSSLHGTLKAVHIEMPEDMTASAFINALRRFIAIRGRLKIYRSERGTNFIGAVNEFKLNTINAEDIPIHDYLTTK